MLNQNGFGFIFLHRLGSLQNGIRALQPRCIMAVCIAYARGNQAFHFLRVFVTRHAGEFIGHAGIKIRPEARVGLHQLGNGGFGNGVYQSLLLHNETVCTVSLDQSTCLKRIACVIQTHDLIADTDFTHQTFDNHVQEIHRLIRFDDHIFIIKKCDVNG